MDDKFISRLEHILGHYALSPSLFADQIGITRSSMSHLLSGRNKPSLDFILKVIDKFPEIDLYWLLKGKGSFTIESKKDTPALTKFDLPIENSKPIVDEKIERVIIFNQDGTFESYNPKK